MRARTLVGRYRKDGEQGCIDVRLTNWRQLFDSRDPAPFRERDLDDDAVAYIVSGYRDLHRKLDAKIVLHLAEPRDVAPSEAIFADSIHSFFVAEREMNRAKIRTMVRRAQVWLVAGAAFLVLCIVAAQLVGSSGLLQRSLKEGLIIMGWVAMWRPIDLLLYAWWPLLEFDRIFRGLSTIGVDVHYSQAAPLVAVSSTAVDANEPVAASDRSLSSLP